MRKPAAVRAFTITELMVALAILSLLLAILCSAVSASRESARTTACSTNMMQLSHAMALYLSDFDGAYPAVSNFAFEHGTGAHADGMHVQGAIYWDALAPYLGVKDGTLHCPSVATDLLDPSLPKDEVSGFAYNILLCDQVLSGADVHRIEDPAAKLYTQGKTENLLQYDTLTVVFGEARAGIIAIDRPDDAIETGHHAIYLTSMETQIKEEPLGATRHRGGANYTFADGHIHWSAPKQLSTEQKCDGKTPGFGP